MKVINFSSERSKFFAQFVEANQNIQQPPSYEEEIPSNEPISLIGLDYDLQMEPVFNGQKFSSIWINFFILLILETAWANMGRTPLQTEVPDNLNSTLDHLKLPSNSSNKLDTNKNRRKRQTDQQSKQISSEMIILDISYDDLHYTKIKQVYKISNAFQIFF